MSRLYLRLALFVPGDFPSSAIGRLLPVIPVQAPVLHGFREVFRGHHFRAVKIGDSAGNLEDPVVSSRGESKAADGHFERPFPGFIERAQLAYSVRRDVGVIESALMLELARSADSPAHFGRGCARIASAEFLVRDGRDFDV
jgi:hypothetical protein